MTRRDTVYVATVVRFDGRQSTRIFPTYQDGETFARKFAKGKGRHSTHRDPTTGRIVERWTRVGPHGRLDMVDLEQMFEDEAEAFRPVKRRAAPKPKAPPARPRREKRKTKTPRERHRARGRIEYRKIPGLGWITVGGARLKARPAPKRRRPTTRRAPIDEGYDWKAVRAGPCGVERTERRAAAKAQAERRKEAAAARLRKLKAAAERPCKVAKKKKLTRPERRELYTSGACGAPRERARKKVRAEGKRLRARVRDLNRRTKAAADRPCKETRAALRRRLAAERRAKQERFELLPPQKQRGRRRGLEVFRERVDEQAANVEGLFGADAAELFRKGARSYFGEAKRRGNIQPYEVFAERAEADPHVLGLYGETKAKKRGRVVILEPTEEEWLEEQRRRGPRKVQPVDWIEDEEEVSYGL